MRMLVVALAAALIAVPSTLAGGFATVGVTPLPPTDGSPWDVQLTVLQHGRTPLDNLSPSITIRNSAGAAQTFAATPAGKPGVYRATVRFPTDGTWSYTIDDGFTRVHTYAPVTIDGAAGDGSFPTEAVAAGAALALALGALLVVAARRRRLQPGIAATTH